MQIDFFCNICSFVICYKKLILEISLNNYSRTGIIGFEETVGNSNYNTYVGLEYI